ncbi:hypothetical protein OS493_021781 [Desmophyllum pertusum]|uniref:Uncharacterized protein n=1 Tax=Desmophyllum pertusum TaxID=174260 RepID=A0A9X0DAE9_9CNID|nr:hypothetical protein OS493_021781 [Desmophyllum pertusum]
MSSANVLPSAPAFDESETQILYPQLPSQPDNLRHSTPVQKLGSTQLYPSLAENFRLTEISVIEKKIADEAEHYRLVLKKYKKARKVIHYSVVSLGAVSAFLSSGAVATSLTGVGIVAGAPMAGIAALSGFASTGLSAINKKLERKVNKHTKIQALALAKHDSIKSFVSTALENNNVSDTEFKQITREMQKYREIKDTLRSNFTKKQTVSRPPDLEKIKSQIRQEFRKKLAASSANLN